MTASYPIVDRTDLPSTRAECRAHIKRQPAGTQFRISIRSDAAVQDDPDSVYAGAITASVRISRAVALRLVSDLLTDEGEARGMRIPCRAYMHPKFPSFYVC